jgi:asparagine synthase (glutamine-hydrolysing)
MKGGVCGWMDAGGLAGAGPVRVAIDGAIDNRDELPPAGSDEAVAADLFVRHGPDEALGRMSGAMALALHDPLRGALYLARDRLGTRPLYYACDGGRLAFAGRPLPLARLDWVRGGPDPAFVARAAVMHYRLRDCEPGRSPYLGVHQVPAGHLLEWRGRGQPRVRPYWRLQERGELCLRQSGLAEHLRDLLMDSVRRALALCRRPAFMLSGGLDSASVLGCAVHLGGSVQPAFSAVYDDPTFDESGAISEAASALARPWVAVRVEPPDVPALVARLVEIHQEPVATATWMAHHLLCAEVAGRGCDAIFGGLGGDETCAGEYEYFPAHFADLEAAGHAGLAREVAAWARHHDHPVHRKSAAAARRLMDEMMDPERPGRCRVVRARILRYRQALEPDFFDLDAFAPALEHPFGSALCNRTYHDLTRETLPCCLRAQERHGRAAGIEHHMPFLDHRLVEWAWRVPGRRRIRGGITKLLLRRAMRGLLPRGTLHRVAKSGWNAPAHRWFAGPVRPFMLELLADPRFRQRGVYRASELRRVLDEHRDIVEGGRPVEDHMLFLWQVLNLELWLRAVEGGRGDAAPPACWSATSSRRRGKGDIPSFQPASDAVGG